MDNSMGIMACLTIFIVSCFEAQYIFTIGVLLYFSLRNNESAHEYEWVKVHYGVAMVYFYVANIFYPPYVRCNGDSPKWYYRLPFGSNVEHLIHVMPKQAEQTKSSENQTWCVCFLMEVVGFSVFMVTAVPIVFLFVAHILMAVLVYDDRDLSKYAEFVFLCSYVVITAVLYVLFWAKPPDSVGSWFYAAGGAKLVSRRTIRF